MNGSIMQFYNIERFSKRLPWGSVSYLKAGKGIPFLIFIHGAGNNAEVWMDVFPYLKDIATAIAVDLPGHGYSAYRSINGVDDYSRCVIDFIETLGVERPVLVGHSMGGAISIKIAAHYRNLSGLILVGTGAHLKVNPRLLKMLEEDFSGAVDLMAKWSFLKDISGDLIEKSREMLFLAGQEVLLQDMRVCDGYSGETDLERIKIPTLIVCGKEDVMTPVSLSMELYERIRGSKISLIDGSGHMVQLEKSGELGRMMVSFIRESIEE